MLTELSSGRTIISIATIRSSLRPCCGPGCWSGRTRCQSSGSRGCGPTRARQSCRRVSRPLCGNSGHRDRDRACRCRSNLGAIFEADALRRNGDGRVRSTNAWRSHPAALLAMITPMAPAFCAFFDLMMKVQVPRSMSAILPATAAALVTASQPSVVDPPAPGASARATTVFVRL